MPLEFLEAALLEGRDDARVLGVGQDDVAAALQLLGFFQAFDLDFAADVLGALAPLEFDGFDAELIDGVFLDAEPRVLDVGLDDDRAVAVLPILEKLDRGFLSPGCGRPCRS